MEWWNDLQITLFLDKEDLVGKFVKIDGRIINVVEIKDGMSFGRKHWRYRMDEVSHVALGVGRGKILPDDISLIELVSDVKTKYNPLRGLCSFHCSKGRLAVAAVTT